MPFYERQPFIQPLYTIVTEVMNGDIRVPRFQRPGTQTTWTLEQRGDLLDSLYRGFPIGTILLWSATTSMATIDVVGGHKIPPIAENESLRLLLDGHQRMSTLVQILGRGLHSDLLKIGNSTSDLPSDENEERWVFDLSNFNEETSSRERFICLKSEQPPTDTQVPLNIVLSRPELNRWIRSKPDLTDAQIKEVDNLRDKLREYNIPVAVLVADSLEDATESFKRINSSGTPMNDFNMVTALAFRDNFDPQIAFEQSRERILTPIGWGDVHDSDVLRVCAGIVGSDPSRMHVVNLSKLLVNDETIIDRAFSSISKAAILLKNCGVHGPAALPYSWQLITIAILVGNEHINLSNPQHIEAVCKWFWVTTYGEVFAGVNSAIYKRSNISLTEMLDGNSWKAMTRDITKSVHEVPRFDFRAVRSKACALAMARQQDNNDLNGPAHQALANGVTSMQTLFYAGQRSTWWHLAIISPDEHVSEIREALKRKEKGNLELQDKFTLEKHGVLSDDKGNVRDLLIARRSRLINEEKKFIQNFDFSWAK